MNKKNKTYILIIAVAAVWGTIGYKIYSNLNPEIPKKEIVGEVEFNRIQTKAVNKIEIKPDYRDPFLGKLYKRPVKKNTKKVKVKKEPVQFPPIDFIGIIKGATTSYIIQINGQQEIFKPGQTYQGVMLKRAKAKNITVIYKGVLKTIQLTE
ncbi:MAG: hypothetical protein JXQ93_03385 [Flavobacteriaceae bacterium]